MKYFRLFLLTFLILPFLTACSSTEKEEPKEEPKDEAAQIEESDTLSDLKMENALKELDLVE